MTSEISELSIDSTDFWFKIVDFLQQNWALMDLRDEEAAVWFIDDAGGVFDRLNFASVDDAERALMRNGFRRFADDAEAGRFIATPELPYQFRQHPNGNIYSSGRYWK
jgi:hypothetical protein